MLKSGNSIAAPRSGSMVGKSSVVLRRPRRAAAGCAALTATVLLAAACGPPAVTTLPGAPIAPAALPQTELAPGHRQVTFRWEYVDGNALTRGDGAARIAAPDSARVDLFLGGFGSGAAFLFGDTLYAPLPAAARSMIPPATMLWGAFGRLAVPAASDTVVHADRDIIRADIGRDPTWRATFANGRLVRLEHVAGGRVVEHVERDETRVRYVSNVAPRRLTLNIIRDEPASPFDPSIWAF